MAVSKRATSSASGSDANTLDQVVTVPIPTGTAQDDLLLCALGLDDPTGGPTIANIGGTTGWTLARGVSTGGLAAYIWWTQVTSVGISGDISVTLNGSATDRDYVLVSQAWIADAAGDTWTEEEDRADTSGPWELDFTGGTGAQVAVNNFTVQDKNSTIPVDSDYTEDVEISAGSGNPSSWITTQFASSLNTSGHTATSADWSAGTAPVARMVGALFKSASAGPPPVDTTDNLGLTDTISRVAVYDRSASDNLGLTDSITTELVAVRDVSDNLGLTDSVVAERLLFREDTDGAGLSSDGYLTTVYNGGASENVAVTLDQAALRIAGDIDLRVELQAEQWRRASAPAQIPIANEGGTATERGCFIYITNSATDPRVRLYWSADGTNLLFAESTVAIDTALADNQRGWLRATLDVNNGASGRDITFYTSTDGVSWSQLGSTITQGGVTSISAAVRNASLGDTTTSRSDIFGGRIYRGQIYDGIGGTLVWDADFSAVTAAEVAAGAFIENTGKTVEDSGASTWDVYSALNIEVGYGRDASDNLDLTDSFTQDITLDRSDSLGLTDALDPFAQTVDDTDNLGLTDTGKRVDFIGDISNDAIGLTDSTTVETFLGVDASDTLGLTDEAAFDVALDRQDDLGLTDAIDPIGLTYSDTDDLGLTDAATIEIGYGRDYTDDLDLTDTASEEPGEAHSDDLDLTDAATWQAEADRQDALGLTDAITVEIGGAVDAQDSLGLTDSFTVVFDYGQDLSDTLGLTDSDERAWDAARDQTDNLGLTDSTTIDSAGTVNIAATDNLGLTDSFTIEIGYTLDLSDALGLTDQVSFTTATARDFTDDLDLTDIAAADTSLTVDVSDDLALTDTATLERTVTVAASDTLGLTDSVALQVDAIDATDTLGLTDSFSRVGGSVYLYAPHAGIFIRHDLGGGNYNLYLVRVGHGVYDPSVGVGVDRERVSKVFAYNTGTESGIQALMESIWASSSTQPAPTLQALIDQQLQDAGYRRPNGLPMV